MEQIVGAPGLISVHEEDDTFEVVVAEEQALISVKRRSFMKKNSFSLSVYPLVTLPVHTLWDGIQDCKDRSNIPGTEFYISTTTSIVLLYTRYLVSHRYLFKKKYQYWQNSLLSSPTSCRL